MALARTVLGDVVADELGVTLSHEHLIIDSSIVEREWPHIHLPSVADAIAETIELAESGVRTLVDAMPIGCGGDAARLADLALATGCNLVASTGMHTAKYYAEGDWHLGASAEDLARAFTSAIEGPAPAAGVIKVATSGSTPTPLEHRLFEAAAMTVAATGAPLLTHCEAGQGGAAQVELIADSGIPLTRVAMSHTDKVLDRAYHRDLLESGVLLCLDQGLRQPEETARLLVGLIDEGFTAQLLIGTDGARRSLWSTLDGDPGLAWIITGFRAMLVEAGVDEDSLDMMFRVNPGKWLGLSI
jgi:predicted metal-dependent phosphotriesterase family hydrolase